MNRVTGISAAGPTPRPKPAAAATAPGFSVAGSPPETVQETQPAQNIELSAMLALQEATSDTVQDKAASRHGQALLQALAELQKALLSPGQDPEAATARLGQLAASMPQAAAPALAALLESVRLRAKIECLRRGVEVN